MTDEGSIRRTSGADRSNRVITLSGSGSVVIPTHPEAETPRAEAIRTTSAWRRKFTVDDREDHARDDLGQPALAPQRCCARRAASAPASDDVRLGRRHQGGHWLLVCALLVVHDAVVGDVLRIHVEYHQGKPLDPERRRAESCGLRGGHSRGETQSTGRSRRYREGPIRVARQRPGRREAGGIRGLRSRACRGYLHDGAVAHTLRGLIPANLRAILRVRTVSTVPLRRASSGAPQASTHERWLPPPRRRGHPIRPPPRREGRPPRGARIP